MASSVSDATARALAPVGDEVEIQFPAISFPPREIPYLPSSNDKMPIVTFRCLFALNMYDHEGRHLLEREIFGIANLYFFNGTYNTTNSGLLQKFNNPNDTCVRILQTLDDQNEQELSRRAGRWFKGFLQANAFARYRANLLMGFQGRMEEPKIARTRIDQRILEPWELGIHFGLENEFEPPDGQRFHIELALANHYKVKKDHRGLKQVSKKLADKNDKVTKVIADMFGNNKPFFLSVVQRVYRDYEMSEQGKLLLSSATVELQNLSMTATSPDSDDFINSFPWSEQFQRPQPSASWQLHYPYSHPERPSILDPDPLRESTKSFGNLNVAAEAPTTYGPAGPYSYSQSTPDVPPSSSYTGANQDPQKGRPNYRHGILHDSPEADSGKGTRGGEGPNQKSKNKDGKQQSKGDEERQRQKKEKEKKAEREREERRQGKTKEKARARPQQPDSGSESPPPQHPPKRRETGQQVRDKLPKLPSER